MGLLFRDRSKEPGAPLRRRPAFVAAGAPELAGADAALAYDLAFVEPFGEVDVAGALLDIEKPVHIPDLQH